MAEKRLSDCTVAIAGLGLMGGSLALALRGQVRAVIGVARRRETLDHALAMDAIDAGFVTLAEALPAADIVVLATPVGVILRQIDEIARLAAAGLARPGAVVTDMGSTKGQISQAMVALPTGLEPVPAHPMCGKETSGLAVAEDTLYQGAPYVLCPLPRTDPRSVALIEALARAVGACPLRLDPSRHDRLAAAISHLPYLLATLLFATAGEVAHRDGMAWQLAAGGFRSSTRLAGSDPTMMTDILLSNRQAILELAGDFQAALDIALGLLDRRDDRGLFQLGDQVRRDRDDFLARFGP